MGGREGVKLGWVATWEMKVDDSIFRHFRVWLAGGYGVAGDDVPSARFGHEMDSKYSFMIK